MSNGHEHGHHHSHRDPGASVGRGPTGDEVLLTRAGDPNLPSLENRVAFQWEQPRDTLGYQHATHKDETLLEWMAVGLQHRPAAALDVGCAYGNHLLMLNAKLGCDQSVRLVGVDLYGDGLTFGKEFAKSIPGYANVNYQAGDLEQGLNFPDDTFDVVNFADVFEHLEDPVASLRELKRVTKPGGTILISTPLRDSLFKRAANRANTLSRGRVYRKYYVGKGSELDEAGNPVMQHHAGHDHISEMTFPELKEAARQAGLAVEDVKLMSVMSGSAWFDRHPFLLSGLVFVEAVHRVAKRPSWAHAVCLQLRVDASSVSARN